MPPMMTILKDVTESWSPVDGWKGSSGATSAPAAPTQAAPTAKASAEMRRTSAPITRAPYPLSATARIWRPASLR